MRKNTKITEYERRNNLNGTEHKSIEKQNAQTSRTGPNGAKSRQQANNQIGSRHNGEAQVGKNLRSERGVDCLKLQQWGRKKNHRNHREQTQSKKQGQDGNGNIRRRKEQTMNDARRKTEGERADQSDKKQQGTHPRNQTQQGKRQDKRWQDGRRKRMQGGGRERAGNRKKGEKKKQ